MTSMAMVIASEAWQSCVPAVTYKIATAFGLAMTDEKWLLTMTAEKRRLTWLRKNM